MSQITPANAPLVSPEPLDFKGHSISYVLFDGVPWFSAADICAAMNYNHHALSHLKDRMFPPHAKRFVEEQAEDGTWAPAPVVSPVGAWFLGHLVDAPRSQGLSAFIRRETARIFPDPVPGDPAIFLTHMDDGELPPRPLKFSGRRSEWLDLKDTGAHLTARWARRTAAANASHSLMLELLAQARGAPAEAAEGQG